MNIKEPSMAKYVESAVPFRDLTSMFLFKESDDMHAFLKELRDTKKLTINAGLVPNKSLRDFQPPRPIHEIQ
jgi:hypothetical protein